MWICRLTTARTNGSAINLVKRSRAAASLDRQVNDRHRVAWRASAGGVSLRPLEDRNLLRFQEASAFALGNAIGMAAIKTPCHEDRAGEHPAGEATRRPSRDRGCRSQRDRLIGMQGNAAASSDRQPSQFDGFTFCAWFDLQHGGTIRQDHRCSWMPEPTCKLSSRAS